jgi:hypothetical protein
MDKLNHFLNRVTDMTLYPVIMALIYTGEFLGKVCLILLSFLVPLLPAILLILFVAACIKVLVN